MLLYRVKMSLFYIVKFGLLIIKIMVKLLFSFGIKKVLKYLVEILIGFL